MTKINELLNDHKFEPRRRIILDGLERCLQKSLENFPKLKGDTMSLCDNSESTKATFNSSYGTIRISTIGNLSGLISAYNTEGKGLIGIFGDKL